jgi:hypothetical protein
MRFMHISKNQDTVFAYSKFQRPAIHCKGGLAQHDFNMDGAFYLSKVDDDNEDSSMWLRYRKILEKYPAPTPLRYKWKTQTYEEIKSVEENEPDFWLNGKKFHFDLDFTSHSILLIDSIDDLKNFFMKYGYFQQKVRRNKDSYWNNNNYDKDVLRFKMMKKLYILNQFIDNLDFLSKERMMDPNKIECVKKSRNIRNMSYVKIMKNAVIIPKKGINFEFLVDIIRTKEYLENIVGDFSDVEIETTMNAINFPKLIKDGYNGIYYSTNIVKFVSQERMDDIKNDKYDPEHKVLHWQKFIERPKIDEIPGFNSFCSKSDMDFIKRRIESYIQWLGSDTMIVWNWIF